MLPNDPELRAGVIRTMIEYCKQNPTELNEWEFNFIYDVAEQFERKHLLSNAQVDKLEQIFEKI